MQKIPKLNPKDFKKFFSMPARVACYNSSFLLRSSVAKADAFLTYKNESFNIYLGKLKIKICGKEGMRIYGNQKRFRKFMEEFKKIVDFGNKIVVPKYNQVPQKITKKEFEREFEFISKFWYYYGLLEFPYMDDAYKESLKKGDKLMKSNLDEASNFKFEARKLMSKFFFKKGTIEKLLYYVSKKILKSKDDGDYLFIEELLKTFNGWKPSKKLISERRKCYSALSVNGKIVVFPYKKSIQLNKKFTEYKKTAIIKGVTASSGKALGRAIISPMLDDHEAIAKINRKMRKGDILIAETTSPDTLMLCNKAGAIVAEQSGMLSHAAIVSRERKIPCIIQATNATRIIKDGDFVEVDANKGVVKIIKRK
jgi:phosphohistidine swiveling domain-containing protein